MKHRLDLNKKGRIDAWFDLCEVTFKLMKSVLPRQEFEERMKEIRFEHRRKTFLFLTNLSRREKDVEDVKGLILKNKGKLDFKYLNDRAKKLGIQAFFKDELKSLKINEG